MVSHSTYNKNTKYDSNETLVFATDYASDDEFVKAENVYGENQWPTNMPELKPAVQEFMSEIEQLGKNYCQFGLLLLG